MTSESADTLPKLLVQNGQKYGNRRTAIREKEYGIWQSVSWVEYLKQVKEFSLGLASLGFGRGDKLAVIGDNRPQLYWAMVAAQSLGGVPVPVYQDAIAPEVQFVIDHSDARVVVVEEQEQADKILEIKDELPQVRWIVYDDPRGLRNYDLPSLLSFVRVQEMGREFEKENPSFFERAVAGGRANDPAIINYTSGTTGSPKGVILTYHNLITTAQNFLAVDPWYAGDELVAYLPMAWIGDTFFSLVLSFLSGATVNCPEQSGTVQNDLREIGPTMTFAPPRSWENLLSQIQVKLEDADWVKRKLAQFFLPLGMKVAEMSILKHQVPWYLKFLRLLGDWLVYGPLRDHLGLRRVRFAITGGAALGPEVFLFFRGLGINLKQIYGLSESSAPATAQREGEVKLDTVGTPIPGVEVKLSEKGEVLLKGPGIFAGYYKNPEATAQALRDGWLATGDAGILDPDGQLVIIDRARDVSHLLDGSIFAPQYIENKLKFSVHIKEAVAIGQERRFVAAMINIDPGAVGNWAEKQGIPYAGYSDLSQKPEVYDLVCQEVQRVNQSLPEEVRINRFALLHKELDPDDAEVTRTRKVRRGFLAQKYADVIEALYSDAREVPVKVVITYEDGRTAEVERMLMIRKVEETARAPEAVPAGRG